MASNRKRLLPGVPAIFSISCPPPCHLHSSPLLHMYIDSIPLVYVSWCKWHLLSRFSLRPSLLPSLDMGYVTAQPTPLCFLCPLLCRPSTPWSIAIRENFMTCGRSTRPCPTATLSCRTTCVCRARLGSCLASTNNLRTSRRRLQRCSVTTRTAST